MRLKKGKIEGQLKQPIDYLYNATLKAGGFTIKLTQYKFPDIYEVIRKDPMKFGVPEIIACQNDRYVIYPIPNKNYYCEIIAAITIKL